MDKSGNAYVIGQTFSTDFPVTPGAFEVACGSKPVCNGDAFVTKLNPTGSALVYSTYLGGSRAGGWGIAVDSSGNAYITGSTSSISFPTTPGAFQTSLAGSSNAFVTEIQPVSGLIATSTKLASSSNPSTYGEVVTFTAVVTSVVGAPPNGETVSFMKGKTVLGTGKLSDGSASLTTSSLPVGTNSITAVYGGDSNFAGSTSKAVKQVVDKATD